jgi:hypothetical protein
MRTRAGLALLLLASTALAGCDDAAPRRQAERPSENSSVSSPPVFTTIPECVAGGTSQADCETLQREAQAEHERTAPRSPTQQACESQYGAGECRPHTRDGQTSYIPALTGFVVGAVGAAVAAHVIGGMMTPTAPRPPRVTPVYRSTVTAPPQPYGGGRGYTYGGAYAGAPVNNFVARPAPSAPTQPVRTTPPVATPSPVIPRSTPSDASTARAPSPAPQVAPRVAPAPQVAPRPSWAAPKVTESPAAASRPAGGFGSTATSRGSFTAPRTSSGFSARGGGGGS